MNKKILVVLLILTLAISAGSFFGKKDQSPKIIPTPTAANIDSDNDGLLDTEEIMRYGTDKNNPDTDGDGYKDGEEVENGFNPLGEGKLADNTNVNNSNNGNNMNTPLPTPILSVDTEKSLLPTAPVASSRFIRIRVLGDNGKWHLTGIKQSLKYFGPYYSPDDVLAMIKELKPDVLDRFISGPKDLSEKLQYYNESSKSWVNWKDSKGGAGGFAQGTVGSFLVQTMQNGAPGAYFIPRLDSEFYLSKGSVDFFSQSQALYNNLKDLGVPASSRFLSLDNWGSLNKQEDKNEVLSTLYPQGWQGIGVTSLLNYHSGINTEEPKNSATWSAFNVEPKNDWKPDKDVLQKIHDESSLRLVLLYIDFPEPMGSFLKFSPDEEARILEQIASLQKPNAADPHETGFTFVYPIAQGANAFAEDWDAKARITEPGGPYGGISIYEFIRDRLFSVYNKI